MERPGPGHGHLFRAGRPTCSASQRKGKGMAARLPPPTPPTGFDEKVVSPADDKIAIIKNHLLLLLSVV